MEIQAKSAFPIITGEGVSAPLSPGDLPAGQAGPPAQPSDPMKLDKLVRLVTQEIPPKRHALPRVVFVVGPTSSGKTDLGIKLAKELGGEIINADARQIYRELSIGTGKPPGRRGKWKGHTAYLVDGVPHYLMDFLPPDKTYTAAQWREAALRAIKGMVRRGSLPIVVGGTGLYVSALIDNYHFPSVAAQPALRKAYEEKSLDELVRLLLAIDLGASGVVDLKNKRRVIRALEVVTYTGKKFSDLRTKGEPLVDAFQVGLYRPEAELFRRIDQFIEGMVDEGLVDEVRSLLRQGYKPDMPGFSAIGYEEVSHYLKGEESLEDMIARIKRRTHQYAKRQWTWFKRDPRIRWAPSQDEAVECVREWLAELT